MGWKVTILKNYNNMKIPNREELLIEANKKLYKNNDKIKILLPHMSLEDYVILLYNECTPSQYGTLFEKRLVKEIEKYTLVSHIDKRHESGDIMIKYPYYERRYEYTTFEIKFTYKNNKGKFNIRNVRLYNEFDYLILGVCDPYNNFNIEYYCIKREDLEDIGLSIMNGTKRTNQYNKNICYGTSITTYGPKHFKLSMKCILDDDSINSLLKFMSDKQIELVENYIDRRKENGKVYVLPYVTKKMYSLNEEFHKKVA